MAWNDELRAVVARARAMFKSVERIDFTDKTDTRPRPLIRSRYGRAPGYRTIYDQWVEICKAAGVADANLHDARAYSATEADRQGLDAQKLLGHDDRRTTKIYLRGREVPVVQGPTYARAS